MIFATHGYDAPELEQNLQRAWTLCQEVEATVELVPILVGLTRLATIRGDRVAHRSLGFTFGIDSAVSALAVSTWSLWLTGWPAEAWSRA